MKRKKRYKHATIGKKKYYFYKIVWEDPCGDAGHADIDEMKKLKPATMISQAYIFAKDRRHVWTFSRTIQSKLCSLTVIVFKSISKKWRGLLCDLLWCNIYNL